jgi:hypothetical protein
MGKAIVNLIGIVIVIALLITLGYRELNHEKEVSDAFKTGESLGYDIATFYATHTNMSDVPFQHYSGEVYGIENYSSFNMSTFGYNFNGTFYPYQFVIYKLTLDLRGFLPGQVFSPYVNPGGTRYVTFRYSDDGPFPGPGYYSFYYLDKDIIEITHWEK